VKQAARRGDVLAGKDAKKIKAGIVIPAFIHTGAGSYIGEQYLVLRLFRTILPHRRKMHQK
jgi:hypothetical protein